MFMADEKKGILGMFGNKAKTTTDAAKYCNHPTPEGGRYC